MDTPAPEKRPPIEASARFPSAIEIPAEVVIEAAGDGKLGPRRMDIRAYNGGKLRIERYPVPVVANIKGMKLRRRKLPIFRDHDEGRVVGHVDRLDKTTGRHIDAQGVASGNNQATAEILASADDGFPWEASIKAIPTSPPVMVPAGKTIQVNGRDQTGPFILARTSELTDISIVAQGGDEEGATVRIAAAAAGTSYLEVIPMEFDQWLEAIGFKSEEITDQQRTALKAKFDAESKTVEGAPPIKAKAGDKQDENTKPPDTRIAELPTFDPVQIQATYAKHSAEVDVELEKSRDKIADTEKFAEIKAKARKTGIDLYEKAVAEEWPAVKLEAECIRAAADLRVQLVREERPKVPAIHNTSRDATGPVIEAALCQSAGLPDVEEQYDEKTLETADRQYRNLGLQETLLISARLGGYTGRQTIHQGNIREVLQCAFGHQPMQAAFSTVSLPGVFSNVANKFLIAGFDHVEQTWRLISSTRPVTDFKAITSYRMTDDFVYEKVPASGEIEHGKVSEESFTNQAHTYAKMFALTRTHIINDDLGAFDDLRRRLGRGAGLKLNRVFWTEFLDNATFFTQARSNLITNTLDEAGAGLAAAVLALDGMTDGQGNPIDVEASILLAGSALYPTAKKLYESMEIRSATGKIQVANIYRGEYQPAKSKYVNNATYGGSATEWYLLGTPGNMPVIEVCFLGGQQAPTVESAEAAFNTLGVEFRGYHDFGCAKKHHRGGVKSTGAG